MLAILKNLFGKKDRNSLTKASLEDAFLVDVRTPSEFLSGHVRGSMNIPLDKIQAQLHRFKGKKNIVVFCRSGIRSRQAKSILEKNGIIEVTNGVTWENINRLINS
jgi:rhodanese-related sulfurtransferase